MFMGKTELENSLQLYKMRNKESSAVKRIGIIVIVLFCIDMIVLISKLLDYEAEVNSISFLPITTWAVALSIVTCIACTLDYKDYNRNHEIFPQNNTTRFISYEMFCYSLFIKIQIVTLLIYLAEYNICFVLGQLASNIKLAYEFSLQFVLVGFLASLMYGFLGISVIILLGTLNRKFKWVFRIIAFCTMGILLSLLRNGWIEFDNILNFIMKESSILLFFIKTIAIWLFIVFISHIINKYTKFYEVADRNQYKIVGVAIALLIIFLFGMFLPIQYNTIQNETTNVEDLGELRRTEDEAEYKVDVSDIPDTTWIEVYLSKEDREDYSVHFGEELINFTDDSILFEFNPIYNAKDWVNLTDFTNTELKVKLENNILYLDVISKENVKVVFLSNYTFMQQFDYFVGKHIFKEYYGSMGGSGGGNILILLPQKKDLGITEY